MAKTSGSRKLRSRYWRSGYRICQFANAPSETIPPPINSRYSEGQNMMVHQSAISKKWTERTQVIWIVCEIFTIGSQSTLEQKTLIRTFRNQEQRDISYKRLSSHLPQGRMKRSETMENREHLIPNSNKELLLDSHILPVVHAPTLA